MDHAVLEPDRYEPIFHDALYFQQRHYDMSSSAPHKEYMEKVYKMVICGFKELPITQKVLEIYEMRQKAEWEGPDSVYNAWLLPNNS